MAIARALRAGKAIIELSLLSGNVEKQLKRLESRMRDFGKSLSSIGSAGLKFSAAIGAPLLGAVKLAADAQEELAKFRQVFSDQADAANQFAEALASSIGRSATDIRTGMSSLQAFFVGLGFGSKQSREFTESLQTLSHDFAAFHNVSDQEAMDRFISAMSGSSTVLQKYGINIKQAALEQALLDSGVRKSWSAVTEQEKAVARLNVIMKSMTDQGAVGAAVRESGSFANQLKRLQGQMKDIGITIGSFVLPRVIDFLQYTNSIVQKIGLWASESGQLVRTIADMAVKVGLASLSLLGLGKALQSAGKAAGFARIAIAALYAHPVMAGLSALAIAIGTLSYNFGEAQKAVELLAAKGSAALDQLNLSQLESMKSSLEWRVFFEKLDYRQLFDEELAGRRSEAERALAAVSNSIEALEAKLAGAGEERNGDSTSPTPFDIPEASQGIDTAVGGKLGEWSRALQRAAQGPISEARFRFGQVKQGVEFGKGFGSERQNIEDDISRARISAMKDGIAKERALIELETRIRMREIQSRGFLNDELKAKLLELQEAELAATNIKETDEKVNQAEAMFDARLAAVAYGGGNDYLREIRDNTRKMAKKQDQPPGIDVG